ncbi:hypothetical protein TRFO_10216 [Tritrichomonas foetus]|uniref:Uncharacterized protein n=1 Tax=Tritrichomonas foetus TaxID=1144522 RepID=A0A1J4JEF4_9EUKA|nr:hypothetical protein TRFO_10216 [Tritrichomonas foetus]|eukprot:OHS96035.1 hypothetical protein TRFO_10216 [Tritrichomonas foetus]
MSESEEHQNEKNYEDHPINLTIVPETNQNENDPIINLANPQNHNENYPCENVEESVETNGNEIHHSNNNYLIESIQHIEKIWENYENGL